MLLSQGTTYPCQARCLPERLCWARCLPGYLCRAKYFWISLCWASGLSGSILCQALACWHFLDGPGTCLSHAEHCFSSWCCSPVWGVVVLGEWPHLINNLCTITPSLRKMEDEPSPTSSMGCGGWDVLKLIASREWCPWGLWWLLQY